MASVQEHYDRHLGPIYGWMLGDPEAAQSAARDELRAAGVEPAAGRLAVDLGAGLGAHAIALAEAGYRVTAVDACAELLSQLRTQRGNLAIECVLDDVRAFGRHCPGPLHVVLCMGDTLTHLPSAHAVRALLAGIARALAPGGLFVATFRDYHGAHTQGVSGIIPVRQDAHRLLTCVLEYRPTRVTVHDIVHERTGNGWALRTSSYPKLRLDPQWIAAQLTASGLATTVNDGRNGMVRIVARRPR